MFPRAEVAILDAGVKACASGLVGAVANARIHVFDVPIGSGINVPVAAGGVAPLSDSLHIHTAFAERADVDDGPSVIETTLEQVRSKVPEGIPVVLMHGYGSGIGIYAHVLPGLASAHSGPVFAIDTLGCGRSSRPRAEGHWTDLSVREMEDFFVTGIERWRQGMGFSKIKLVGHSAGGYLAVAYSERYPQHVEQLVTIGCAGVPEKPPELEEKMKKKYPYLAPIAIGFWSKGISPFNIMRWGMGSMFFSRYAGRYSHLPWLADVSFLQNYLHMNWVDAEVSAGGYMHVTLLSLAAFAHDPLRNRIPSLDLEKPVRMLYGEGDWMDPTHAIALRDQIRADDEPTTGKPKTDVEVARVSQGGHNIPLENPTGLIEALVDALHDLGVDDGYYRGSFVSPRQTQAT